MNKDLLDESENLELALNPNFINAMCRLVDALENAALDLEKVETIDCVDQKTFKEGVEDGAREALFHEFATRIWCDMNRMDRKLHDKLTDG